MRSVRFLVRHVDAGGRWIARRASAVLATVSVVSALAAVALGCSGDDGGEPAVERPPADVADPVADVGARLDGADLRVCETAPAAHGGHRWTVGGRGGGPCSGSVLVDDEGNEAVDATAAWDLDGDTVVSTTVTGELLTAVRQVMRDLPDRPL